MSSETLGDIMRVRLRTILPCAWVVLPVLGACLVAVLATMANGPVVGLVAGGVTGLVAAFTIERPMRALAGVVARIAGGDRYAIVPSSPKVLSPSLPRPRNLCAAP